MLLPSPDAQWIATRRGRDVSVLIGTDPPPEATPQPLGSFELESDDVDLAMIGPPNVMVVVVRGPAPRVELHEVPSLELAATLALDAPMRLAAITGPRVALTSLDGKRLLVVRAAGRALSLLAIEPGSAVEFVIGLERNQLLVGTMRRLEVFDAVSARPLLRMQLQLPPPPRTVGAAQGHLWARRPGSDEVLIYRLSDGRPFRHVVGSPIEDVVCHPMSPVIVLVTPRGLVRLHCFAHSLAVLDSPWQRGTPLAQFVAGDDLKLIGGHGEPWRIPIGATAAVGLEPLAEPVAPLQSAADRMRAMRESLPPAQEPASDRPIASEAPPPPTIAAIDLTASRLTAAPPASPVWRDPIATFAAELVRDATTDRQPPARRSGELGELGELADRLDLAESARNALCVLYGLHLVGEPSVPIARLARILGDWVEPLGQGELGALAMLRRRGGRISLRATVAAIIDGVAPRSIRILGSGAATGPRGAIRVARAGRSNDTIEHELAARLGRIAVIEGGASAGVLEARLHGITAVVLAPPAARPLPWPRDAGLVVVADAAGPEWIASLPMT